PEYMAPEQFSDPSLEDERLAKTDTTTDVYSLGIIFYEMLTGQKLFPFKPNAKNQQEYARALLSYLKTRTSQRDDDLKVAPPQIPPALWSVIARALRVDPKIRQRTAVEMAADIRRYVDTGQGVIVEDEDKTSAIDLNSVLALHGDPSGISAAVKPAADGGRKTMPLEPINPFTGPMAQVPSRQPQAYTPQATPPPGMRAVNPSFPPQPHNPYMQPAALPPGYDTSQHMQATNPHFMGHGYNGTYSGGQTSSNTTMILWAVLIALIVVGVGVAVALVVI